MNYALNVIATVAVCAPMALFAQSAAEPERGETLRQISTHVGEMSATIDQEDIADGLRLEPFQLFGEMILRDDVVYLMRHGPTDWSKLDVVDVSPTDCENQRIMSPEGAQNMRDLGSLLAFNDIVPSQIVVSEWCRNQQTLEHLTAGYNRATPGALEDVPVQTDAELNLLLSLQGAKNVTALRERISAWEGDPDRSGPLLIITHYTNIEELTQFGVFEGEILVLDPQRNNQVLGTLRLRSASPDVGHFADALESPLLYEEQALDMVARYYNAINAGDIDMMEDLLSDRWVVHGESAETMDVQGFFDQVAGIEEGLADVRFDVEDVHVAEDVVTVVGTIRGTHTGVLYGAEPTGEEVAFGAIAVHQISNGEIVESWKMADRLALMEQLGKKE